MLGIVIAAPIIPARANAALPIFERIIAASPLQTAARYASGTESKQKLLFKCGVFCLRAAFRDLIEDLFGPHEPAFRFPLPMGGVTIGVKLSAVSAPRRQYQPFRGGRIETD